MTTIGHQLRGYRVAAQLNQRELAEAVGCDRSLVCRVESGARTATRDYLMAVIRVCNLTITESNDLLLASGFAPLVDVHLVASYSRRAARMDDEYRALFAAVWRDSREDMVA